jgi:hypothetical protein
MHCTAHINAPQPTLFYLKLTQDFHVHNIMVVSFINSSLFCYCLTSHSIVIAVLICYIVYIGCVDTMNYILTLTTYTKQSNTIGTVVGLVGFYKPLLAYTAQLYFSQAKEASWFNILYSSCSTVGIGFLVGRG